MNDAAPPVATAEAPSLATATRWIVIAVGSFYLLRELGPILKPLWLAVLLGYVILPIYGAIKRRIHGRLALVVSIALTVAVLFLATAGIQASVRALLSEQTDIVRKGQLRWDTLKQAVEVQSPEAARSMDGMFSEGSHVFQAASTWIVGLAADAASSAVVVGLYLIFMLLEAGRFPDRVRKAFSPARAERILEAIGHINRGIAQFFVAKVKASIILAVPVTVVLWQSGTPLAVVWGLWTFFCNFIPYIGSVAGYGAPVLFAYIQFGFGFDWVLVAVLLMAIHLVTASVVEPAMIGKAVGLSPVIILFALAFWGYCWGLTGVLLAVPLTVMAKIVASHLDATRPVARLLSDE